MKTFKPSIKYILLFSILLTTYYSNAQNKLTGKITSTKGDSALSGVSVYIPDIKIGTVSKADGSYELKDLPKGTFLVEISAEGYASQSKEITLHGSQTASFSLSASGIELQEVVVTGVSSATEQRSNPVSVNIVTHKDILQNSATNLIDAISISPGVNEITLGPNISKPVIRGLGYNRVVTMNDGVRQEGQQWFDEFGIEIDEFSVYKAEILKGPASLSYGSDAMAGVINFLPFPTLPEGQIKGNILANYQTNNGLFAESINLGGNNKGFIWDLRYSNKMAHDYKNRYDGYVWNSAYSESNAKAILGPNKKWGYSHLTLSSFDLKMGVVEGARDSATGNFTQHFLASDGSDSLGIAPSNKFTSYNYFPIIHQHIRHYKAVLDNSFAMGTGRLNLILGFQQNLRQEANDITQGDIYNNYFHLNTINYDLRYVFREKNHFEMSAGVNGMQQNSLNLGTAFVIPEYSLFDIGGFVIAKKEVNNNLSVSGGLRYDTRTLKGKDLWVDSTGARKPGPGNGIIPDFTAYTSNFSGFSASIGAAYNVTKELYLKANIARGFRAPTAAESGANGLHDGTPFFEIGDHNLKAEGSLEFDGTIGINSKDVSAEATGFVNYIDNYIFAEKLESVFGGDSIRNDPALALAPGPAFKYVQGNSVLSGGEFTLDIHPADLPWLNFDNSFSFVSAVQKNQSDSTKYLPYTPPGKYRTELKFICTKGKVIKNSYVKIGMDYYLEQNKIYYKYGNETVTPAYTLFNAGIGADICSHDKCLFSIYIYGSNLGDVAYQSSMSRLKYTDINNVTGRTGVYNMGRNISFKLNVPIDFTK